jgi:ketosteroid isomerase-like protein
MGQRDIEVMEAFFDMLAAGDISAATKLAHPDIVINEGSSLPWGGEHVGHAGFENVIKLILGAFDLKLENWQFIDGGSCVVALIRGVFTSRTTGQTVEMPAVEIYRLQDALVRHVDVYYKDTKAVVDACAKASAGSSSPGEV